MSEETFHDPADEKESQCPECGEYEEDCVCDRPVENLGPYHPNWGKDRR